MAELLAETKLLTKEHFDTEIYIPKAGRENYGTVTGADSLSNKVVCLFFSAAWCAPCQHFVPMLSEIYTELRRRDDPIEVVFISYDKTQEEMEEYFQKKHGDWLALKFGDPIRETLADRYIITVIPKLVVIQPNGDIITTKGRKDVQDKGVVCMRGWHSALVKADKVEAATVEKTGEEAVAEAKSDPVPET